MDQFQEEQASKEEDKLCSSLQWTRWKTYMAREKLHVKLHAISQNQGSLQTKILGNLFIILYVGAI